MTGKFRRKRHVACGGVQRMDKTDILMCAIKSAAKRRAQTEAQSVQRVRFGKEEQGRERDLTYKISRSKRYKACSDMVEVGGVEPPSESTLTGLSPGADGYCGSLSSCSPSGRQAVTPSGQVRVMMRGRVNSFPPHGRHINDAFPGLWPLRFRRPP